MGISYLICASFLNILFVPTTGDQINARIKLKGTIIIGRNAQILCHVSMDTYYAVEYVRLQTQDMSLSLNFTNEPFTNNWKPQNWSININPLDSNRISFWPDFPGININLNPLQCADEQVYTCTIVYTSIGNNSYQSTSSSTVLAFRVQPNSMNIVIDVNDYSTRADRKEVYEEDDISAVCSGLSSSYVEPVIDWIVFCNKYLGVKVIIDLKPQNLTFSDTRREDKSCSRRHVQQKLLLSAYPRCQFIVILCYLRYKDSSAFKEFGFCWNETTPFCARSERIYILRVGDEQKSKQHQSKHDHDHKDLIPSSVRIIGAGLLCTFIGCVFGATMNYDNYGERNGRNQKKHLKFRLSL